MPSRRGTGIDMNESELMCHGITETRRSVFFFTARTDGQERHGIKLTTHHSFVSLCLRGRISNHYRNMNHPRFLSNID